MSPESNRDRAISEFSDLLDLSMPGDTNAISGVTDAISSTLADLQVAEGKRLEIMLAVQEALANAVVHGCQNDASKQVRCRVQRAAKDRILIVVTDPGPGFNPEELMDPRRPENVSADHGRGVYLIRQLMDEVQFDNGGKEIKMWKF
jgi:serine/threonine-protein kinase RsbW